jgi:hypothetical protein
MLFDAAGLAALALYSFQRLKAAAPVPTEQKADFVAMGAGSQAVLQMDPRGPAEDGGAGSAEQEPAPPPL